MALMTISMVGKPCPICRDPLTENEDGDAECITDDIVVALRAGTQEEMDVAAQAEHDAGLDVLRFVSTKDATEVIYRSADDPNEHS